MGVVNDVPPEPADHQRSDGLRVTRNLVVPPNELTWRFTGSGGPGGQHANTANTKVDLRFDIDASRVLNATQRQRLLRRFGSEVRVVESSQRSQSRNREVARRRLGELLRDGLRVKRRRQPTKPGRGAVERRLKAKRQRAEIKRQRRRQGWD